MNELIKITETNGKKAVSAKELHKFLEVKTSPILWFSRMFEYGFEEGVDYVAFKFERSDNKQSTITDFALTIDCAKEISMLQKTEKGKQARLYFIECEKQVNQFEIPQTYSQALLLAAKQAEQIELQNNQIKELTPKAKFFDAVTDSKTAIDMGEAAKLLDLGFGRNTMFERLRDLKILMSNNQPYQKYIDNGCFRTVETKYTKPDGSVNINIKTLVYQKGMDYILKVLK